MSEPKRYNLALPEEMFNDVTELAKQENTTFLEVIKRFIKFGLRMYKAQKQGSKLIIRTGDVDKEIVIL